MAKLIGKDETVVEPLDASLEVLQPDQQFVEIAGEKIYVKPYTFGKLLKALKYLGKLQNVLGAGQDYLEEHFLEVLADHGEDVVGLISLSTDLPVEYFDEIPSDKGLDLAIMTYKVNESFFAQNLLPKLQELFPSSLPTPEADTEAVAVSKKVGSTSSKN